MNNTRSWKQHTLCETCSNSCGNCSWSARFVPVEGWTAKPTLVRNSSVKDSVIESFEVSECPLFAEDKKRHTESIRSDRVVALCFKIIERAIHDYAFSLIKTQNGFNYSRQCKASGAKEGYIRQDMLTCEAFFRSPLTGDMLAACGIKMSGDHIIKMIKADPQGVLDRMVVNKKDSIR